MKIKGYDKLIKDLKKLGTKGHEVVEEVTALAAGKIEDKAQQYAPVNFGKLRQGIKAIPLGDLTYIVVAQQSYSAYVEFGTGAKANIPDEMVAIASQFQGGEGGTFEQGLQAIKDWCKKKGISEEAAYPIFISILRNGVQAQPFLYPAFVEGREFYIKKLETELDKLIKETN